MAIREFSPEGIPRAKIAFTGRLPTKRQLDRFRERNFSPEKSDSKQLADPEYVAQLGAVVLTQDPKRLNALPKQLGEFVPSLLDQDVRVYVRLADATGTDGPRQLVVRALQQAQIPIANLLPQERLAIPEGQRERENSFMLPCVYILESGMAWPDVAALICDHPAGPAPKFGLEVDEEQLHKKFGSGGHDERVLLLKRAFWNCSQLHLTSLPGGMSGAPVFKVYATLDASLISRGDTGAYPHLYFAKIGPRKKIIDEYDKYCGHVFEYVPFHLGPSLRRDRCNLGSTQGILVGDFVEGAESLVTCAQGARCGHAISNLFDKTLGGWRKQRLLDTERPLSAYLEIKWFIEGSNERIALPDERAKIVRALGGETAMAGLHKLFAEKANTLTLIAPAHGDMHATNVLVRHGDAIIIDFEKLEANYPLTYDPASLEGGLLVEGFIVDFERGNLTPDELVHLIRPLYERKALGSGSETNCKPGTRADWYYSAVNQIRALSWSSEGEPSQYALTLALCLIRKGCNPHEALHREAANATRAVAFFLGQKLLRETVVTTQPSVARGERSAEAPQR